VDGWGHHGPVGVGDQVGGLLGVPVVRAEPLGGAVTGQRWRVGLADGRTAFVKSHPGAPDGYFAAEVAGLALLTEATPYGGPQVPAVLAYDQRTLVLPWIDAGSPTPAGAERLGRELAALHAVGTAGYGAPWPGWVGAAELDNRSCGDWPTFYVERRVEPYVRRLAEVHGLPASAATTFDRLAGRMAELAGPAEPPARIHGDLWNGNVLWAGDGRAWLVDPAAHGGHRETDLAMLGLFDAPHLGRVLAAYDEVAPLSAGWRERVGLHQLHPLLVHAVLFGGGYGERAVRIARGYVG
jgi:fructosamine-3-kinase